jgi:hypothetical protein
MTKTTTAWDGTPEEFWKCIDHVRSNSDTEGDAAVLSEILYLAQCAILQLGVECEHVAKLARAEALSQTWRGQSTDYAEHGYGRHHDLDDCANELEQALRGEP